MDDFQSDGCDPIGVHEQKVDGQTVELVCGASPLTIDIDKTYTGVGGAQPVVTDSSFAYESCPHFSDQCDSNNVLKGNVWGNLSAEIKDVEQSQYNINKPLDILLSDDASWVGINVDSKNSTICSYKFQNDNSKSNVY